MLFKIGLNRVPRALAPYYSKDFLREEDEQNWENWALELYKDDSYQELETVFKGGINERMQYRILAMMLIPTGFENILPFKLKGQALNSSYFDKFIQYVASNKKLVEAVAQLLVGYIKWIDLAPIAGKEKASYRNTCNRRLLSVMSVLDEKLAEELFVHYHLNDLGPEWIMETPEGYDPYLALLKAEVPNSCKVRAFEVIKEIASRELRRKSRPEEEWEREMRRLANDVHNSINSENNLSYSAELLNEQLRFIMKASPSTVRVMYIYSFEWLLQYMEYLDKDVLQTFAYLRAYSNHSEELTIYSKEGIEFARKLVDVIEEDSLKKLWLAAIEKGKKRVADADIAADEKERRKQKILDGLK